MPESASTPTQPLSTARAPRTSTGSPAASASDTAATSSSSVVARTQARAGPPSRSVVWSASRPADPGASANPNDRLGGAEHLLAAAGDLERDRRESVGDA